MSGMISAIDKLREELQACKLTRTKPAISVVDNACDEIEAEVSELLSGDKKTIYDWLYFAFALEHNDLFFEFIDKLSKAKVDIVVVDEPDTIRNELEDNGLMGGDAE